MLTNKLIFTGDNKTTVASNLYQVIDIIQEDLSGSQTRKKYETFVTGSGVNALTSSLYQTVYDQDFTLQTANPVLDITVGLFHNSSKPNLVTQAEDYDIISGTDQLVFNAGTTCMMREKVNIYRQYAALLLGDANRVFNFNEGLSQPSDLAVATNTFDAAAFINIKRLFSRDGIRKNTFALRLYEEAPPALSNDNLFFSQSSETGGYIIADIGSNTSMESPNGQSFGWLVKASDTTNKVGLIFYDAGIVVLNLGTSSLSTPGTADRDEGLDSFTESNNGPTYFPAFKIDEALTGSINSVDGLKTFGGNTTTHSGSLYPDLLVSASIDDIVDHLAFTRFQSGSLTAMAFQNKTSINSALYFCRANANSMNASNNPTWSDALTSMGTDPTERFTYITGVGLYDSDGTLVATAKLNRPIEKNPQGEVSIRVRLDF